MKWIAIDPLFCVKTFCIGILEFSLSNVYHTCYFRFLKIAKKIIIRHKEIYERYKRIVNSIIFYFRSLRYEKFFGKLIPRYLVIKPATVNVDVPHSVE